MLLKSKCTIWSAKEFKLLKEKEALNDCKIFRFQEWVNKGPYVNSPLFKIILYIVFAK